MELVIASANPQKVLQLKEILKGLLPKTYILSLIDFPKYVPPHESQTSDFYDSAKIKAESARSALSKDCIAESWRLVLPALDLKMQSLFTEKEANTLKIKKIIEIIRAASEIEKSAFLESSVCFASIDGKTRQATARIEGMVSDEERGHGSSDFDSIFIKHDYMKTLAELSSSVRNRISHRAKAVEKLLIYLETRQATLGTNPPTLSSRA